MHVLFPFRLYTDYILAHMTVSIYSAISNIIIIIVIELVLLPQQTMVLFHYLE